MPGVLTLPGKQDANFNANVKGGQKTTLCRGTGGERDGGRAGTGDRRGQGQGTGKRGQGKRKTPACAGVAMGETGLAFNYLERMETVFPFRYGGHWPHVENGRNL